MSIKVKNYTVTELASYVHKFIKWEVVFFFTYQQKQMNCQWEELTINIRALLVLFSLTDV